MADGYKYVECKSVTLVKCKYGGEGSSRQTIDFYPFVLDKYTGMPTHTGFTQVPDSVLESLKKDSPVFNAYTRKGGLVIHDSLPASAQTPQEMLLAKDKEIYNLQSRLAQTAAEQAELASLREKVIEQNIALEKAHNKIKLMEKERQKEQVSEPEPAVKKRKKAKPDDEAVEDEKVSVRF